MVLALLMGETNSRKWTEESLPSSAVIHVLHFMFSKYRFTGTQMS